MRTLIVVTIILLLVGCQNHDIQLKVLPGNGYLPLEVGNYWEFQAINPTPFSSVIHREVVDLTTINDQPYFMLVNSSTHGGQTYKDTVYYRVDTNGFVYTFHKSRPDLEENLFHLNAKAGDSWTFLVDGDEARMSVTESSLTLGNIEVTNCKNYYFDMANWADEEYTYTLAPGLGFVKEYSNAWGLGQILKSAKIHGQVYNF